MPEGGTILAFDFGTRRIGVALGSFETGLAHPLATIHWKKKSECFDAIDSLAKEWNPSLLVVGLPLSMDGEEHELTRLCRLFGRRLEARYRLPVEFVDERLSSFAAEATLREAGIRGRAQKQYIDQVAAQQILQSYLESGRKPYGNA
ncbi:MAG: Holliday junction resolvase RuvX [Burkholderiales bacterium]|nr:Holliday junction resolvase RuvX [Burkholderiales bacterium]